ncbi:DUF3109 family protein [soil metagenome]
MQHCIFAPVIAIDNILVSDRVVEEQFVCDLNKCKGGCCAHGDAGAPLDNKELKEVDAVIDAVLPYMTEAGRNEIARQGRYVYDKEFGWVTPTINGEICVYGLRDKSGIIKCAIEHAYNDGKIGWKKPISCHLYPIRTKKSNDGKLELVNYEPRQDLCKAACSLGKKLKVPVYVFLKESLTRKYGEDFYRALCATAEHIKTK